MGSNTDCNKEEGEIQIFKVLSRNLGPFDRLPRRRTTPQAPHASDQQRLQRFIQEAKSASALNRPHILTIHEIGTVENLRFMATEFIDGGTLRQHLHSGIKLSEILEIAIQTASALAAAHAVGILHRDVKSEKSWCGATVT
ncbi:MAG TPA: protein kinase [Pyrinomonadaceae bacterium]|nr:protein kinase [Pyrinomonadaceae bacterium]